MRPKEEPPPLQLGVQLGNVLLQLRAFDRDVEILEAQVEQLVIRQPRPPEPRTPPPSRRRSGAPAGRTNGFSGRSAGHGHSNLAVRRTYINRPLGRLLEVPAIGS